MRKIENESGNSKKIQKKMEILIEFAQKDGKKPHKTGQNRTSAGGHGTVSGNWTALVSPPHRLGLFAPVHDRTMRAISVSPPRSPGVRRGGNGLPPGNAFPGVFPKKLDFS